MHHHVVHQLARQRQHVRVHRQRPLARTRRPLGPHRPDLNPCDLDLQPLSPRRHQLAQPRVRHRLTFGVGSGSRAKRPLDECLYLVALGVERLGDQRHQPARRHPQRQALARLLPDLDLVLAESHHAPTIARMAVHCPSCPRHSPTIRRIRSIASTDSLRAAGRSPSGSRPWSSL